MTLMFNPSNNLFEKLLFSLSEVQYPAIMCIDVVIPLLLYSLLSLGLTLFDFERRCYSYSAVFSPQ